MAVSTPSTTSPGGAESSTEPPTDAVELPLDVTFELLSNQRRRYVLRYLLAESDSTTLGELAEHIAGIENEKPPSALSSDERKRVYICLYQCHLPKMDDADVIDFDGDRKTVDAGENLDAMVQYLPEGSEEISAAGGLTGAVAGLTAVVDRGIRTLPIS